MKTEGLAVDGLLQQQHLNGSLKTPHRVTEEFSRGPDADNCKKTKKAGKEKHEVKH